MLDRLKVLFKNPPADTSTAAIETPAVQQPTGRVRARAGIRILIADDSPTVLAVLGRMLRQERYEVLEARSGQDALTLAVEQPPDLVLLDIVMPGMSGFAVLRALRRDPATKDVPVIMISGNLQATEQFYGQRIGADAFIRKPFGRNDVVEGIQALVEAGRLPTRDTTDHDAPNIIDLDDSNDVVDDFEQGAPPDTRS